MINDETRVDDSTRTFLSARPPIDLTVASASLQARLDFHEDISVSRSGRKDEDDDLSDDGDEIFAELEKDDFDSGRLRERRLEALKTEMDKARAFRESDHGKLTEISNEKEVVQESAKENLCIIHFYHRDFRRCDIMNKHLEILAPRHFGTRFLRVFVENVPWLVERLEIKVLPCVICFVRGVTKDRLIGFEELGNDDAFTTAALELRLSQSGVISPPQSSKPSILRGQQSRGIRDGQNDKDDWGYD